MIVIVIVVAVVVVMVVVVIALGWKDALEDASDEERGVSDTLWSGGCLSRNNSPVPIPWVWKWKRKVESRGMMITIMLLSLLLLLLLSLLFIIFITVKNELPRYGVKDVRCNVRRESISYIVHHILLT